MSLLKPLFEEASKRFDGMHIATADDIGAIVRFIEKQDSKGYFYYPIDKSRLRYNLTNPEYVWQLVNDKTDLVVIVPEGNEIKAFTHWGLDQGIVWNYYTVVKEKTNGIGAKLYDAFMPALNSARQDYAADFVETPFMARLCNLWTRYGARPFGLFTARYSDRKGRPLASTMFGRFFSDDDGLLYVPRYSEEYANALLGIHGDRRLAIPVDATPEAISPNTGIEEIVAFNDKESVARLTREGYMLTGIMPGMGTIFSQVSTVGIEHFRVAALKSSSKQLKHAFTLFDEYLSIADKEVNKVICAQEESYVNERFLSQSNQA